MGFFDFLHGGKNPSDSAMPYFNQIPGQTSPYFQPYFNAGTNQVPGLQDQYSQLMHDPGGRLNEIGNSFHESPGFKFALQQALQGAGHAAAAGGMAGSPEHEMNNMGIATNLANQDYYNYLTGATGLYNQGMQGSQGMANQGQQAGQSMADMLAQNLSQRGDMAFRGRQEKNSMNNSFFSGLGKLGGAALGGIAGGPWGAFAGYNMSGAN